MTYEKMVQDAWRLIQQLGLTEDENEFNAHQDLYLVSDIYAVRDALITDVESGLRYEDLPGFLDRHKIAWK